MCKPQWEGFTTGDWTKEIDVRGFIQANYTPYEGDDSFLSGTTKKTEELFDEVKNLMSEENEKGILDAETKVPSSITALVPGYVVKEIEVIVGIQTDKPLMRGI
ncbi:pyruvate formate lyase family protein, partial [Anaerosporobacter sp.]